MKNIRVVYSYSTDGKRFSDNLILVPKESEEAHRAFFTEQFTQLFKGGNYSYPKDLCFYKIGEFDVKRLSFKRLNKVVKLFNVTDLMPKKKGSK